MELDHHVGRPDQEHTYTFLTQILSRCVTDERPTSSPAPRGIDDTLARLQSPDHFSNVLIGTQFSVWYAYVIAASHIDDLEEKFCTLPPPMIQRLANEVSKATVHSTVITHIRRVFCESSRAFNRQKSLGQYLPALNRLLGIADSNASLRPSKRPRLEHIRSMTESSLLTGHVAPQTTGDGQRPEDHDASALSASLFDVCVHLPFDCDPRYQHNWPPARNLPFVFQDNTCDMIVKRDDHAAVGIHFDPDMAECVLSWDIRASDVPFVAKELYNYNICNGEQRYIHQINGGRIAIYHVVLDSATQSRWQGLMGDTIAGGIENGPARMAETKAGLPSTKCVTLLLCGVADHPGRLSVKVEVNHLSMIKHKLWL
ncbi:hypothetical protein NCS52_01538900 [Fusarium sp. LHS14.1]|nr:hypothetical protein NCS52_01538900 [Fusarium sp. LHS14.1]